jgi:sRNA-binding protein
LTCGAPPLGSIAITNNQGHDMKTKLTKSERNRRVMIALARFAELYPACFVADASGQHRPLKIGIHRDLIEHGVQPAEALAALQFYTRRPAYRAALIAGGPRYDLSGNRCGNVSDEEIAAAKIALDNLEGRVRAAQERSKAERLECRKNSAEEARKAFEAIRTARIEREAEAAGRLTLAGLKAAAQARKAAQRAA